MVCLDTSLIIDIMRGNAEAREKEKELDESSEAVTVATPTILELIRGAKLSNKPQKEKQKVHHFLSSLIVLNLDKDSAMRAGEIDADLKRTGQSIDVEDIMIAAICLHNAETLITKNARHFERVKDLKIETY